MTVYPCPARAAVVAFAAAVAVLPLPVQATSSGVVLGPEGVIRHAKVCLDTNGNGRCDRREPAAMSSDDGTYSLPHAGALVAEVGPDAEVVDPDTGTAGRIHRALLLRAPSAARGVIGPLSTEVVALSEGGREPVAKAVQTIARRLGVAPDQVLANPFAMPDVHARDVIAAESLAVLDRIADAVARSGPHGDVRAALADRLDLEGIETVVVVFDENRSFNNVFNGFPGADTLKTAMARGGIAPQKDRDGSILKQLPPAWGGLTAAGQPMTVTQAQTTNAWANAPFAIDARRPAWGEPALPPSIVTRDLYHRFFESQMQIDGGRNDQFAAWGDSGGLVMGYWDGPATALWKIAADYTLADHFFQGAFGGSFLNHVYLVCACAPRYPDADTAPAAPSIAVLDRDAKGAWTPRLTVAAKSPASALDGPPAFARSGNIAPRNYFGDDTFRAVNTMQPPYQPSGNAPAPGDAKGLYADPSNATTLPVQTEATIGDRLDAKGISWAWYSGGWNAALADRRKVYQAAAGNFQAHHQPFNYFAEFDPAADAANRAAHLKDYEDFMSDAAAGRLPAVAFYKPVGVNNEHPGYASLAQGDAHVASVIEALRASPQWRHMLVVVTYDEFGGQWDELAPPAGDRLGPGTRVPAVIVSPYARRHFVDHTTYDTGSVLRFISHRWSLQELDGLLARDRALESRGLPPMGDLTQALQLHPVAK